MNKDLVRLSKFLSLVLRHKPDTINLKLDSKGWAKVDDLLKLSAQHGVVIMPDVLKEIVETNDKKRFAFSDDGLKIRASQGHSININLGLIPETPPEFLYHGTATRLLNSIYKEGLTKQKRQHVHLSKDSATATKVGQRHGRPVVLTIEASKMYEDGYQFFLSDNGVWLTDHVPAKYISCQSFDVNI